MRGTFPDARCNVVTRNTTDTLTIKVRVGHDANNPRRRLGRTHVNPIDVGMGMDRAHNHEVEMTHHGSIRREPTFADEETQILASVPRLTTRELHCQPPLSRESITDKHIPRTQTVVTATRNPLYSLAEMSVHEQ